MDHIKLVQEKCFREIHSDNAIYLYVDDDYEEFFYSSANVLSDMLIVVINETNVQRDEELITQDTVWNKIKDLSLNGMIAFAEFTQVKFVYHLPVMFEMKPNGKPKDISLYMQNKQEVVVDFLNNLFFRCHNVEKISTQCIVDPVRECSFGTYFELSFALLENCEFYKFKKDVDLELDFSGIIPKTIDDERRNCYGYLERFFEEEIDCFETIRDNLEVECRVFELELVLPSFNADDANEDLEFVDSMILLRVPERIRAENVGIYFQDIRKDSTVSMISTVKRFHSWGDARSIEFNINERQQQGESRWETILGIYEEFGYCRNFLFRLKSFFRDHAFEEARMMYSLGGFDVEEGDLIEDIKKRFTVRETNGCGGYHRVWENEEAKGEFILEFDAEFAENGDEWYYMLEEDTIYELEWESDEGVEREEEKVEEEIEEKQEYLDKERELEVEEEKKGELGELFGICEKLFGIDVRGIEDAMHGNDSRVVVYGRVSYEVANFHKKRVDYPFCMQLGRFLQFLEACGYLPSFNFNLGLSSISLENEGCVLSVIAASLERVRTACVGIYLPDLPPTWGDYNDYFSERKEKVVENVGYDGSQIVDSGESRFIPEEEDEFEEEEEDELEEEREEEEEEEEEEEGEEEEISEIMKRFKKGYEEEMTKELEFGCDPFKNSRMFLFLEEENLSLEDDIPIMLTEEQADYKQILYQEKEKERSNEAVPLPADELVLKILMNLISRGGIRIKGNLLWKLFKCFPDYICRYNRTYEFCHSSERVRREIFRLLLKCIKLEFDEEEWEEILDMDNVCFDEDHLFLRRISYTSSDIGNEDEFKLDKKCIPKKKFWKRDLTFGIFEVLDRKRRQELINLENIFVDYLVNCRKEIIQTQLASIIQVVDMFNTRYHMNMPDVCTVIMNKMYETLYGDGPIEDRDVAAEVEYWQEFWEEYGDDLHKKIYYVEGDLEQWIKNLSGPEGYDTIGHNLECAYLCARKQQLEEAFGVDNLNEINVMAYDKKVFNELLIDSDDRFRSTLLMIQKEDGKGGKCSAAKMLWELHTQEGGGHRWDKMKEFFVDALHVPEEEDWLEKYKISTFDFVYEPAQGLEEKNKRWYYDTREAAEIHAISGYGGFVRDFIIDLRYGKGNCFEDMTKPYLFLTETNELSYSTDRLDWTRMNIDKSWPDYQLEEDAISPYQTNIFVNFEEAVYGEFVVWLKKKLLGLTENGALIEKTSLEDLLLPHMFIYEENDAREQSLEQSCKETRRERYDEERREIDREFAKLEAIKLNVIWIREANLDKPLIEDDDDDDDINACCLERFIEAEEENMITNEEKLLRELEREKEPQCLTIELDYDYIVEEMEKSTRLEELVSELRSSENQEEFEWDMMAYFGEEGYDERVSALFEYADNVVNEIPAIHEESGLEEIMSKKVKIGVEEASKVLVESYKSNEERTDAREKYESQIRKRMEKEAERERELMEKLHEEEMEEEHVEFEEEEEGGGGVYGYDVEMKDSGDEVDEYYDEFGRRLPKRKGEEEDDDDVEEEEDDSD